MGDGQSASDAQQETWLAVVRHIARLRTPEAFTVWFYRIARSKVMGVLGDSHEHVPLDEQASPAIEDQDDPFTSDDADRVHAGLAAPVSVTSRGARVAVHGGAVVRANRRGRRVYGRDDPLTNSLRQSRPAAATGE